MPRTVIKIEALPQWNTLAAPAHYTRRVAAYARVSTASDEQLLSVEAQKDYYPKYIATHPNWSFAGLYADEGISGTSSKKRDEFNRMIADALEGKFDLIITKSISRFARNTLDTLTAIRKLKDSGVEVYFEKEQIFTFDSKGEFMLTLLSSMAQEESRSLSENVKWGCRKRFADGRYSLPYKQFLGYRRGADGKPEIVEEEAVIVRKIFRMYLEGGTPQTIGSILSAQGLLSPGGRKVWQVRTIVSILTNEKYYGAALLQKGFTEDYLTKKRRLNKGELPKYYIENDHAPIVSRAAFVEVQQRMSKSGWDNPSLYLLSNKIICGECGGKYGRKIQGSYRENKKYRKAVWKCNQKYTARHQHRTPVINEETVIDAYQRAILELWNERPEFREICRYVVAHAVHAKRSNGSRVARLLEIDAFLAGFGERLPESMTFDDSSFRVMVESIVVTDEPRLSMFFFDGSNYTYLMPWKSSPKPK